MKVYFYDKETKEFTAEAEARKDPRASERLGKDVWLLPANATFDVPPVKESGKAVVFDNGWKQIADNRGKDIIKTDGVVSVVNYLGDLKDGDKLISAQEKAGLEDGSLIYKGGNIIPKPAPTDDEISATRARLYAAGSDNVFASYQQGVASLQDYVDAKAQIGFDNKKSTQTGMTLDDFKHKVSREYELFKQAGKVIKNTTYDYKESSGTDNLIVSDADISLIRPTTGVNVILPAITKTQIVKIDNVSDATVNISSANSEFIDGVSSPYTLQSKDVIEFIADVSKKSWDVLRTMGAVKAKALTYLQVRVATSFPEDTTIFMNDYTSGNSCFMVVALDGDEVSETLLKYELDTGESIMFAKRYLGELYSTKFISSYDLPKTVWVVKGFKTVEEKQMSWRNDKVTTWTPLEGLQSYRFSGTDTPNKLPIGKLKEGSIPADLTPWKKVEGKDVGGVENDWAFYADANIEVDAVVNLRVDTLGEVVYFFLTKEGKEIQGSRVSVTMSENTVDNALKVPTMKAKVSNGDLIGWSFQATTKDGAWLETDSVANPLATVTIRTEGAI